MSRDRTLAFAGLLQCGELVRQIATSGQCSQAAASVSINSVFAMEADSVEDIFSGVRGLRLGLSVLVDVFGQRADREALPALNYALGLVKIAKHVRRDRRRMQALGESIELSRACWEQAEQSLDASLIAQLADGYQQHISSLRFRLAVHGRPDLLQQDDKVALIRALLLAGTRAAFLWHQLGGRPWRLILQRSAMLQQAEALIGSHG